ncbi:MAG: protein TolA, partial [Comamonas sp.]
MSSRFENDPFAPPRRSKYLRAWLMALAAHILLIVALIWNVRPPKAVDEAAVEAELWSEMPTAAAPRAPTPPPPPEP